MGRVSLLAVMIVSGCFLEGCGRSSAPTADRGLIADATGAAEPAPASAATASAKPVANVAALFPAGPGREQVLNTCGSCHPVACTARGQRTAAQWDRIQESHKEIVAGVNDADRNVLFSYLKANFNDSKPEPVIPAEFLQQGCTPF